MNSFKFYIPDFFLVALFLLDVSAASISNYTLNHFLLKAVISVVLIAAAWYHYRSLGERTSAGNEIGFFGGSGNLHTILAVMTAFFAISLTWSSNVEYGALKLLNFVISTVPAVYVFGYLVMRVGSREYGVGSREEGVGSLIKMFVYVVTAVVLVSIPLIIFLQPFHYLGSFNINITNWSHIIYGRFVCSVFVVLIFLLLTARNKKWMFLLWPAVFFSSIGVLLSGYRAGVIGAAGVILLFLVYLLVKKGLRLVNFYFLASSVLPAITLVVILISSNSLLSSRYSVLEDFEQQDFKGDSSIQTHYQAYDAAVEMIKDSPLIGEGFGSFKNFRGNYITDYTSYPHNIFLEFAAELGIIGLLFFLVLLALIFYYSWKLGPPVMFFFLFALFLAQFSKDISANTLLWLGVAGVSSKE